MINDNLRTIVLKILPNSFVNKKNKEVYWNAFWLMNGLSQFFIMSFLLIFYFIKSPELASVIGPYFIISLILNLVSIGLFYRSQGICPQSMRLLYVSTFLPILTNLNQTGGLMSYVVIWMLVTHVSGVYLLKLKETLFWTVLIIGTTFLLFNGNPNVLSKDQIFALSSDNLANFILIALTLTSQIVIYRFINEQNEKELSEAHQQLQFQFEENQSLIRILVHDIANPVSIIDNYLKMEKRAAKGTVSKYIEKSLGAAEKIKVIINDARTMQKLKDEKGEIEFVEVELSELVKNSIFIFEEKLRQKNIQLVQNFSPVYAKAHESLFSNQIFANLMSNAIKFTPDGGQITLATFEKEGYSVFSIKDSGVGIPDDLINKLFDVKAQTTRAGTSGEQGTGYGLPIVKSILNKMGGRIAVRSKSVGDETGTQFDVYLPVALKKAA